MAVARGHFTPGVRQGSVAVCDFAYALYRQWNWNCRCINVLVEWEVRQLIMQCGCPQTPLANSWSNSSCDGRLSWYNLMASEISKSFLKHMTEGTNPRSWDVWARAENWESSSAVMWSKKEWQHSPCTTLPQSQLHHSACFSDEHRLLA